MDAGDLVIPHPRLHKRRFVLQPLCDIAPDMLHPVLKVSMAVLLAGAEIAAQPVEVLET
jgi:7,8-dihydro-6-hydroxymethylpterin-pyrophosphokinase